MVVITDGPVVELGTSDTGTPLRIRPHRVTFTERYNHTVTATVIGPRIPKSGADDVIAEAVLAVERMDGGNASYRQEAPDEIKSLWRNVR